MLDDFLSEMNDDRPRRPRLNLDDLDGAPMMPPMSVSEHHLRNAITSTCVALQFSRQRSQAMACWSALRLLLAAKFGPEERR